MEIAIQVARSRSVSRSDLSALRLFKTDYPEARCALFYGGSRGEYRNGIELIPMEEGFPRLAHFLSQEK
ncbi:MAG: hypothetical protein ABSF77_21590 [Spirochaetia bacterium]|jgi:hypothetical protein